MTKLDELATDIANLGTTQQTLLAGQANLLSVITTEDASIQSALTALGGSSTDPQVQALIDAVTTQQTNIAAAAQPLTDAATDVTNQTAALNAAVTPPPPAP